MRPRTIIPIVLGLLWGVGAQEAPPPLPEEAPQELFATTVDDEDLVLYAAGTWESSATFAAGWARMPDGTWISGYVPEDLTPGFAYTQQADFLLSLWYMERYFVEITVQDDLDDSTYLFGYRGKEGEVVQSVRAGNTGVGIGNYRYLDLPGPSRGSLGVSASFVGPWSFHEFMVRLDPSTTGHIRYRGLATVDEIRKGLGSYTRGRFFVLPDTDLDSLTVYLEDGEGTLTADDGTRWRRAREDELSYSLKEGTLALNEPPPGRVAVYYTVGGVPVGDASLGREALCGTTGGLLDPEAPAEDFDWGTNYLGMDMSRLRIDLESRTALLVYVPAGFTPFEALWAYEVPEDTEEILLVERDSEEEAVLTPSARLVKEGSLVTVRREGEDARTPAARYPFAREYPLLYGPRRTTHPEYPGHEILLRTLSPVEALTIPADAQPGTVRVLVNGQEETAAQVDYETGVITLPYQVSTAHTIDIYYRTREGEAGTDLVAASGNTFSLSPHTTLNLAASVRYPLTEERFTSSPGEASGDIRGSVELDHRGEGLDLRADVGIRHTLTDTTGYLRLLTMEKGSLTLRYDEASLFPAAPPADTTLVRDPASPLSDVGDLTGLSPANRGKLIYKDYYHYTVYGRGSLQDYTWTPPEEQIHPYTTGEKTGPYLVAAEGAGFDEACMALDFELADGESWTGGQIPIGDPPDEVAGLSLSWKADRLSGSTFDLYLQIGPLAEDIDADGVLEEEGSPYDPGFPFHDTAHQAVLRLGTDPSNLPDNRMSSEDANGNGLLDPEDTSRTLTFRIAQGISSTTGWNTLTIHLPPQLRALASQARTLRLLAVRTATTGASSGRILFSAPTLLGSPFHTSSTDPDATITASTGPDPTLPASSTLVSSRFEEEADQKSLTVTWDNAAPDPSWSWAARTSIPSLPAGSYRRISIFLKNGAASSLSLLLSLTTPDGRGLHASGITLPADDTWHLLTLDTTGGGVLLDETPLSGASLEDDAATGSLTRLALTCIDPPATGRLHADEVFAHDPENPTALLSSLTLTLSHPSPLVSLGSTPLLHRLTLTQQVAAVTPLDETPTTTAFSTHGSLSLLTAILGLGLSGTFHGSEPEAFHLDHSLTLPAGPLTLTDTFGHTILPTSSLTHSSSLGLSLTPVNASLSHSLSHTPTILNRTWTLTADLTPSPFGLSGRSTLSQTIQDTPAPPDTYPDSYLASWEEAVPLPSDGTTTRTSSLTLSPTYQTPHQSTTLTLTAQTTTSPPLATRTHTHTVSLTTSHTLTPQLTLSPFYTRTLTLEEEPSPSDHFPEDWTSHTRALARIPLPYTSIPFYELFLTSNDLHVPATDTLTYTPRTGLSLTLPPSLTPLDLLIPRTLSSSFGVTYTLTEGRPLTTRTLTSSLAFQAINLFGAQAAHPLTTLYLLDEFTRILTLTFSHVLESAHTTWTLTWNETAGFYIEAPQGLLLSHTLTLSPGSPSPWKEEASLSYVWDTPAPSWTYAPPLEPWKAHPPVLRHTEQADLTLTGGEDGDTDYAVSLTHTSTLLYGTSGNFRAFLSAAVEEENQVTVLGWMAGLAMTLQF
ncbi:hypothetical protein Spith_0681 [Spirochaeta thermophila DSM 6578]|uniref:Uncharacterized protein n=1 Tax=Winmispira thermophila (strain ATCC 700085 / DSM 6578 / Z-1203) TaxID=869211 RepID=G0GAJ5_WINT7|nr:hypothetical protein [Spirochaeta thermophila]AEJ60960.1 hypothetical protein Spith_0681 [Spirochaeta thermophila DSM 6578]